MNRNGKTGTAALPVSLAGQADFHGSWTGSLARPHIAGTLQATQLALEMPAAGNSGPPQFVRFDSVSAAGQFAPSQIAIQHAQLQRGDTRIVLSGTLDASPGPRPAASRYSTRTPCFMRNSTRLTSKLPTCSRCLPRQGARFRSTGALYARIEADGPLHAPSASGSVQMERRHILW